MCDIFIHERKLTRKSVRKEAETWIPRTTGCFLYFDRIFLTSCAEIFFLESSVWSLLLDRYLPIDGFFQILYSSRAKYSRGSVGRRESG